MRATDTTHLTRNSVDPNTVREEERDGDTIYVVESVPFVRSMVLSNGYVPEDELTASADGWDGVPLTAGHPRNDAGNPIPVKGCRDVLQEHGVGWAENPRYDGTWLRADLSVNADIARAMGGPAADIVEKIEAGEPFDVSSQYLNKPLPPAQYDGQYRQNVDGIREPDSIALLPDKRGKCSIDAGGCGINPQVVANAAGGHTRAGMAELIVANTDEYDDTDAVREDFPTKPALRVKLQQTPATGPSIIHMAGDATANSAAVYLPDGPDVSSGVLTE